jgi:crossover junction endodeoxyribonuclease RuvC
MIVGIDPGVSGAIAWLEWYTTATGSPAESLALEYLRDLPTMQRGKTGNKQQINGVELAALLRDLGPVEHAYLELVRALPPASRAAGGSGGARMGTTSAFNFGHSFGKIEGVLEALAIPYTHVPPERWKKPAGLGGAEKDASRTRAIQLFPGHAELLKRKKDVGRAEAILIAFFGSRAG